MVAEFLQPAFARLRKCDFEILGGQQGFEALANFQLIINDKNRSFRHGRLS